MEADDADFAASRAYYGYFYVAESLLLSKDLRFSRHSQVIAQYGFHFAKTNLLDPRFHRLFDRAFTLRQLADYSADPDILESQTVRDLIEGRLEFLAAAKEYLNTKPQGTCCHRPEAGAVPLRRVATSKRRSHPRQVLPTALPWLPNNMSQQSKETRRQHGKVGTERPRWPPTPCKRP